VGELGDMTATIRKMGKIEETNTAGWIFAVDPHQLENWGDETGGGSPGMG